MADFEYFQEQNAEHFSFYRVPKVLFTDERFRELSSEAKLLYGAMLDRVSLSRKNGWLDENGIVYIHFTAEEIMEHFHWTRYKAFQLLDELDTKNGIGLIERRRVGCNQPNVLYVKNFASEQIRNKGNPEVCQSDVGKYEPSDIRKYEQSDFRKCDSQISESMADGLPEVRQSYSNKTDTSKTEKNNTDRALQSEMSDLFGTFQNVSLSEQELSNLRERFPYDWQERIERLSSYMASSGKSYRSHYATICSWAARDRKSFGDKNYTIPEGKGL